MKYLFFLLAFTIIFCSCQTANQETAASSSTTETQTAQTLPPMPKAQLVELYQKTDDVDILFLEKSFSVNGPEATAKNVITHISDQATTQTACKEICYFFIKSQGEQVAHVGAFLDEGCAYYVFYENNKAIYVNAMTEAGLDFLNRILTQVKTSPN